MANGFIIYKEADHRYLRPIQKLQQKTTGISYNEMNSTTNVSENINITKLMNTADGAIRDNIAIGESISVGGNMACGKNIVNSGDIYTNNIFAKSILIKDAVIENTILANAKIDDVPISSRSLAFISTLTSDVQLQLDTNSKQIGPKGADSTVPGPKGEDGLNSTVPGPKGEDGLNSTLAGYFVNQGVGTFPIYGSMNDFSSFGLNLYIKGEKDSFIIMPYSFLVKLIKEANIQVWEIYQTI
jgi:hypothetical protein